jgi:hypothetical protein
LKYSLQDFTNPPQWTSQCDSEQAFARGIAHFGAIFVGKKLQPSEDFTQEAFLAVFLG